MSESLPFAISVDRGPSKLRDSKFASLKTWWQGEDSLDWAIPDNALGVIDAPIAMLLVGARDIEVECASRGFMNLLGVDAAAVVGRRLRDIALAEFRLSLTQATRQAIRSRKTARFACGPIAKGQRRMSFSVKPMPGDVNRFLVEARRDDDEHAAMRFDRLGLVQGGRAYVHDLRKPERIGFTRLLGYPKAHSLANASALPQLIHPDDVEAAVAHRKSLNALADGAFATLTLRLKHIDGSWRWVQVRERICGRTDEGKPCCFLGFAIDVTEEHRLAASLASASKALLTAEAQERQRIARELHDSTAQHLIAIDLTLSRLERRGKDDEGYQSAIDDIRFALTAAHREVRTFSYLLHPPDLERLGFESTLRRFVEGFGRRTGLVLRLKKRGTPIVLGSSHELALFRVAQEALMNVHRHAHARTVDIRVRYRPGSVVLEVQDDGVGMPAAEIEALLGERPTGVGIAAMQARMDDLGGGLAIQSMPRGLLVQATLPRPAAAERPENS